MDTIEDLQARIIQESENVSLEAPTRIFENMKRRVNLCIEAGDQYFQQLF